MDSIAEWRRERGKKSANVKLEQQKLSNLNNMKKRLNKIKPQGQWAQNKRSDIKVSEERRIGLS